MVVDRRRVVHARDPQAPGEALRLCGRVEEVRGPVERDHPREAAARDDAGSRGRPVESVRRAWRGFPFCNRGIAFQHTAAFAGFGNPTKTTDYPRPAPG